MKVDKMLNDQYLNRPMASTLSSITCFSALVLFGCDSTSLTVDPNRDPDAIPIDAGVLPPGPDAASLPAPDAQTVDAAPSDSGRPPITLDAGALPPGDAGVQPEAWRWTNPLPNSNDFHAATFFDGQLGLAGGARTLKRTTNGGATWTEVNPELIDLIEGIRFTSATHVVAAGMNLPAPARGGATAMTSDDGGLTWTVRPFPGPTTYFINGGDLDFDGSNGAAVGMEKVFVSIDAGVTWIDRSPSGAMNLGGVRVKGTKIWISGGGGALFFSNDLGVTWTAATTPPATDVLGVDFIDDQIGVASGGDESIWRTVDGGANWTRAYLGARGRILRRVRFFDSTHAIAVGWDGACVVSVASSAAEAGSTWAPCNSSPYSFMYLFAIPTAGNSVWAAGTRGLIFRSDDYGATWSPQIAGYPADFRRAFFLDGQRGWAVGELGGIIQTRDGGLTWQISLGQYDPYAATGYYGRWLVNSLNGVFFVDANNGWAVGGPVRVDPTTTTEDSVILHTTDGGATWSPQRSGTRRALQAIGCANALECWIAGNNVLLHTADGGLNWIVENRPELNQPLTGIAVISSNELWISGQVGTIAHSIDAGRTWVLRTGQLGGYFNVRFADANHGVFSGVNLDGTAGGELTTDGGRTWSTFRVGNNGIAMSAALAPDLNNGIATTSGGEIWRTRDGGRNWTMDTQPTWNDLLDVWPTTPGFTVVGGYGSALVGPRE